MTWRKKRRVRQLPAWVSSSMRSGPPPETSNNSCSTIFIRIRGSTLHCRNAIRNLCKLWGTLNCPTGAWNLDDRWMICLEPKRFSLSNSVIWILEAKPPATSDHQPPTQNLEQRSALSAKLSTPNTLSCSEPLSVPFLAFQRPPSHHINVLV